MIIDFIYVLKMMCFSVDFCMFSRQKDSFLTFGWMLNVEKIWNDLSEINVTSVFMWVLNSLNSQPSYY